MHWPIGIYFATLLTWLQSVQILMIPVIIQKKFSCMISILEGVVFQRRYNYILENF
ncbi:hypothetical protein GIB67_035282 [Kingdonia uniflora]|uniref:Uncharacterized protein n=1 Tax=Kingdonia uniflora TaxID=39325 RepID=A0A7J7KXW9_9MAGN|nr:hypothetical protein GIB67_035282 [Kingdonia uniflora]